MKNLKEHKTKALPHIMHIIDSLAIGGAERMLVDIANSTDKSKFSVSVCVTRSDITLAKNLLPDIPLRILNRQFRLDPLLSAQGPAARPFDPICR